MLTGVTTRWLNCQPESRQRVYFANHTSHLDTLVLWAALPPEIRDLTRPAAAKDYWGRNKFLFYLAAKVFRAVLIKRENVSRDNNPLDLILEAIGERYSLIIFPEGTRHPGPDVGKFKSGLYHLGKRKPGLELVPVYIENLNRILPKGEFIPLPLLTCITFGPPLQVQEKETKECFLARAHEAVVSLKGL